MQRNAMAIVIAVLLLLAGLYNIGAGIAHFGKAELVSGTTTRLAAMGESVAAANTNNPFAKGTSQSLRDESKTLRDMGSSRSLLMYVVAVGIVVAAVLQVVGGVGVFTRSDWASRILLLAGVGGLLVEVQDMVEDGVGAGQLIFLCIAVASIYLSLQLKVTAGASSSRSGDAPIGR